jgi:hypothetical protein
VGLLLIFLAALLITGLIAKEFNLIPSTSHPPNIKETLINNLNSQIADMSQTEVSLRHQLTDFTAQLSELVEPLNKAELNEISTESLENLVSQLSVKLISIKQTLCDVRMSNVSLNEQLSNKLIELERTNTAIETSSLDRILIELSDLSAVVPEYRSPHTLVRNIQQLFCDYPILDELNRIGQYTTLDQNMIRLIANNTPVDALLFTSDADSNIVFMILDNVPVNLLAEL